MTPYTRPHLLYLVGDPGVGKTTTLQLALADHNVEATFLHPFLRTEHTWYADIHDEQRPGVTITELGGRRSGGFGGTDAMAMNAQPKVLEWLRTTQPVRVVAEGDRLGNSKFFQAVRLLGYDLSLIYLTAHPFTIDARRKARQTEHGTQPQNMTWLLGRATKTANLISTWSAAGIVTVIDVGTVTAAEAAHDIRRYPFFRDLPPFFGTA